MIWFILYLLAGALILFAFAYLSDEIDNLDRADEFAVSAAIIGLWPFFIGILIVRLAQMLKPKKK